MRNNRTGRTFRSTVVLKVHPVTPLSLAWLAIDVVRASIVMAQLFLAR